MRPEEMIKDGLCIVGVQAVGSITTSVRSAVAPCAPCLVFISAEFVGLTTSGRTEEKG